MDTYRIDAYQNTSAAGFTKRMMHQSPGALVFTLNFEPGQTLPSHTHAECEILVVPLTGEGRATIDGQVETLRPGTAVRCDGSESFSVENTGTSRLSLLVVLYPGNPRFAGNVR